MGEIDDLLQELLDGTGASRVTLRQDVPGEYRFPVTHEALAPGVGSLKEERTVDLRNQPVALEVAAGRQVVQDDCATAYDDPAFQRMRETYGGLAAADRHAGDAGRVGQGDRLAAPARHRPASGRRRRSRPAGRPPRGSES